MKAFAIERFFVLASFSSLLHEFDSFRAAIMAAGAAIRQAKDAKIEKILKERRAKMKKVLVNRYGS